jgi:branched-chain amino acid transport system ATP-binding protein
MIRRVTEGKTLVMVEHDMGVVFGLADRISVLVYGQSSPPTRRPRSAQRRGAGSLPRHQPECMTSPMLEIADLHAYYGKSHILHGVKLHVGAGEIVCLLGRNGVGRSTTAKAVMGQVVAKGSRALQGPRHPRHEGLRNRPPRPGPGARDRDIFPDLTVKQNLMLGIKDTAPPGAGRIDDMYALFPRLKEREDTPGGVLSGGEQQMLTICRTLMGDPDLIMIDEPTEGLAPKIVEQVGSFLQEVAQPRHFHPADRTEAGHRARHLRAALPHGPRPHRLRRHARRPQEQRSHPQGSLILAET